MTSKYKHFCRECGEPVKSARYALGYKLCLLCGDEAAKGVAARRTIAPAHKGNYMFITNLDDLKDLNPKYIRSAR
jgi:ribosomal protein L37AE/L43A